MTANPRDVAAIALLAIVAVALAVWHPELEFPGRSYNAGGTPLWIVFGFLAAAWTVHVIWEASWPIAGQPYRRVFMRRSIKAVAVAVLLGILLLVAW